MARSDCQTEQDGIHAIYKGQLQWWPVQSREQVATSAHQLGTADRWRSSRGGALRADFHQVLPHGRAPSRQRAR